MRARASHDFYETHVLGGGKMAAILAVHVNEVALRVTNGESYRSISNRLHRLYPGTFGLSARSVRHFCRRQGVHYRSGLTDSELDREVALSIQSVGHSYGRRTLQGLLRARGIHVSQRRRGMSMSRVAPGLQQGRRNRANRHLIPPPYSARFFADKLHLDQNEKLGMYGTVYVLAIDGFSRRIVGMLTIPVKNAVAIYNSLFHPLLLAPCFYLKTKPRSRTNVV